MSPHPLQRLGEGSALCATTPVVGVQFDNPLSPGVLFSVALWDITQNRLLPTHIGIFLMIPSYFKIKILVKCREYSTLGFKGITAPQSSTFHGACHVVSRHSFVTWDKQSCDLKEVYS